MSTSRRMSVISALRAQRVGETSPLFLPTPCAHKAEMPEIQALPVDLLALIDRLAAAGLLAAGDDDLIAEMHELDPEGTMRTRLRFSDRAPLKGSSHPDFSLAPGGRAGGRFHARLSAGAGPDTRVPGAERSTRHAHALQRLTPDLTGSGGGRQALDGAGGARGNNRPGGAGARTAVPIERPSKGGLRKTFDDAPGRRASAGLRFSRKASRTGRSNAGIRDFFTYPNFGELKCQS